MTKLFKHNEINKITRETAPAKIVEKFDIDGYNAAEVDNKIRYFSSPINIEVEYNPTKVLVRVVTFDCKVIKLATSCRGRANA